MILLSCAVFITVFGRAIQQQNVIGGHYLAASLTPYLIAIGDVGTVLYTVQTGWAAIPWAGTGGAFGAVSAMWLHRKLTGRTIRRT
jgi:hypothetical protein